jgi:flavin-binding protein dodecin
MFEHVHKMVEVVDTSTIGTDDAIRRGIEAAAKTLRHSVWFEVVGTRGRIAEGRIAHYQVSLRLGYRLEP